jgi:hypothetical protein
MVEINLFGRNFRLLVELRDFSSNHNKVDSFQNLVFTSIVLFLLLWVVEHIARSFWSTVDSAFTKTDRSRIILGRHSCDLICMLAMALAGYESLEELGGWRIYNELILDGKVLSVGFDRVYKPFSAACQRLAIMQVAYEAKNFCDSIIHNDGIIFLMHHLLAGFAAIVSATPFMHIYAAFYLGYSEISTFVLCAIVLFDKERGLPGLAEAFPTVMTILGAMFATLFTAFRIVLWPYVTYYFWLDMQDMWEKGTMHSRPVCAIVCFINITLTLLQFWWFKEILDQTYCVLTTGKIMIKRGSDASEAISQPDTVSSTAVRKARTASPARIQPSRGSKKQN